MAEQDIFFLPSFFIIRKVTPILDDESEILSQYFQEYSDFIHVGIITALASSTFDVLEEYASDQKSRHEAGVLLIHFLVFSHSSTADISYLMTQLVFSP